MSDRPWPQALYLRRGPDVPNNYRLPVLIYRCLLPTQRDKAAAFKCRFQKNGWHGLWRDTVYDYHHFHSNAHEVLGIARGTVDILLGGRAGKAVRLKAGDMIVLPAGTGHKRVRGSADLSVVGAYPYGQSDYDMRYKGTRVPRVPLPKTDPFYGAKGPLVTAWR